MLLVGVNGRCKRWMTWRACKRFFYWEANCKSSKYSDRVTEKNNKLVLFMHPASYYSKIAMLAFHEKNLQYQTHFINVFTRENLHPWFLKLNPKGQLPVLQDGEEITCGSDVIIHHLEAKFDSEQHPKLLPPDGTEDSSKVKEFVQFLRTFQNNVPTYGVVNFPELSTGFTMKEYERNARLELLHHGERFLDSIQKQFPEMSEFLNEKRKGFQTRYEKCKTLEGVKMGIKATDSILDRLENHLATHKKQQPCWLCTEFFSEADVTLAVLLCRLEELGLVAQLLDLQKRPFLNAYMERLKQRQGFQEYLKNLDTLHMKFSSINNKPS